MSQNSKAHYAVVIALACLFPNPVFGAGVSFSQFKSVGRASSQHADLNNDGREDFISVNPNGAGFTVQLSTGDGTYAVPASYKLPNQNTVSLVGIGDFNSDGKADLVVVGLDSTGMNETLFLYLNNGGGIFTERTSFPLSYAQTYDIVIADFNHDGRMDIAFEEDGHIDVWVGNGKGGFTVGPTSPSNAIGNMMLGDFDGDGYADLAISDRITSKFVQVLFGDGTGSFPVPTYFGIPTNSIVGATDVNGDGRMDIVASSNSPNAPNHIEVYYGDPNRNWNENTVIPIAHCASGQGAAVAADMNGDGIKDLIVPETDCGKNGNGYNYIGVLTRNSNATYNPDQIVYKSSSPALSVQGPYTIRGNRDTKPDIALTQCTKSPCLTASEHDLRVLLNTTSGAFHSCEAPAAFEGINVCSPTPGGTATSPISFRVGAAGQVEMRKVEVWVDGKKAVEQLNGFSKYSFLDDSLVLMSGTHRIAIYAAGWDNSLQEKSFNLNVK